MCARILEWFLLNRVTGARGFGVVHHHLEMLALLDRR